MHRLATRIASGYVVFVLAIFLLLGAILLVQIRDAERSRQIEQLEEQAQIIAAATAPDADSTNVDRFADVADGRITLLSSNGEVVADSLDVDPSLIDLATSPVVVTALNGQTGQGESFSDLRGLTEYAVAVPIVEEGSVNGVVRLAIPADELAPLFTPVTSVLLAGLSLGALLIIAVVWMTPRIVLRPLYDLVNVARRVSDGDLHARARTDRDDEIAELAEALNDMTDELRAKLQDIDQERAQLETIVDNLNDGILIVDPRGAVILINRVAEQLLSTNRQRALVRSYTEVVRDHELVDLIRNNRTLAEDGNEPPNRFIDLGWPRRSVQAFAYPVSQPDLDLVVVILRDITELRKTETVRRDFVANVSHDLRTPIASLKALVDTLLDGALEDETVARDFLGRMEIEVNDLVRMVEELLELSRAESRRITLRSIPADLGNVIRRAVARIRTHAEPKQIHLQTAIPADLPPGYFDPERVEQVLVNLLHNAVKFTPVEGTITLELEQQDDRLVTVVRDSGPGIPEDEVDRVFERFYKSDRSRGNSGSGLGLAIAKHMIQLHGGRIWASSRTQGGAEFRFTLPVATGEEVPVPGRE